MEEAQALSIADKLSTIRQGNSPDKRNSNGKVYKMEHGTFNTGLDGAD